jgi:hypothetical protein
MSPGFDARRGSNILMLITNPSGKYVTLWYHAA